MVRSVVRNRLSPESGPLTYEFLTSNLICDKVGFGCKSCFLQRKKYRLRFWKYKESGLSEQNCWRCV